MEERKELFKALAAFQQQCPTIHKATETPKTAKGFSYTYADLPTIFEVINPILKENGLGFTQLVEGKTIKTIVFHCETGQSIESVLDIPQGVKLMGMNDFQILGSAITYLRRYSISSILGIVTDKDTDAGGIQERDNQPQKPYIKEGGKQWTQAIERGVSLDKLKEYYSFTEQSESEYIKELLEKLEQ